MRPRGERMGLNKTIKELPGEQTEPEKKHNKGTLRTGSHRFLVFWLRSSGELEVIGYWTEENIDWKYTDKITRNKVNFNLLIMLFLH